MSLNNSSRATASTVQIICWILLWKELLGNSSEKNTHIEGLQCVKCAVSTDIVRWCLCSLSGVQELSLRVGVISQCRCGSQEKSGYVFCSTHLQDLSGWKQRHIYYLSHAWLQDSHGFCTTLSSLSTPGWLSSPRLEIWLLLNKWRRKYGKTNIAFHLTSAEGNHMTTLKFQEARR